MGARATSRKAFTLVEILATLALIAIVMPTVMGGISLSLRAADFSRHQAIASALAREKMSELVALNQWDLLSMAGDFSPDHPDYRWTAQLNTYDSSSTANSNMAGNSGSTAATSTLQQLDVTVTWTQDRQDRSVTLTTVVTPLTTSGVSP